MRPMTYLEAAKLADQASFNATNAAGWSKDDAMRQLAQAVAQLSQAMAEVAKSLHRASG